jgi:hypothetical protein
VSLYSSCATSNGCVPLAVIVYHQIVVVYYYGLASNSHVLLDGIVVVVCY